MSFLPKSRGGALWRFCLGAVIVVGFVAATTAVAGLLKFKQVVTYISASPALKHAHVTLPNPGQAQTILIIGSDHRAGAPYNDANTDTMMLMRLDPNSKTINVMSVPRDLEVQLPTGGGVSGGFKLNAAYSIGGPNLLIDTLRGQVFPGLVVNHILDVNFAGFSDLVDAIGCVYSDVDHRYYNNTLYTGYSSIDIQPGYQKLCGDNQADTGALAFVRFRHTDSDIVRNARQQDFIRWAKDQFSAGQLLGEEDRLLRIFGHHVETDPGLHHLDQVIDLFNLIVFADGHAIKQIPFPASFTACGGSSTVDGVTSQTPCFVTSTSYLEQKAYRQFITPTHTSTTVAVASQPKPRVKKRAAISTAGLTLDVGDGKSQAAQLRHIPMPVYFPKRILATSRYCFSITGNCYLDAPNPQSEFVASYPRAYEIHGYGNAVYPAYRFTLVVNTLLGEYYGVQGTTWRNPPILHSPTRVQVVGGKKLLEFFNGHKLSLVAWRTPQAAYWISNTLTDSIGNSQLIGIAASLTPAVG